MAFIGVKETQFMNPIKSIVAIPDGYITVPVVVDCGTDTGKVMMKDDMGRKYLPAGTLLKGVIITDGTIKARESKVATLVDTTQATSEFDAIVFNDEYVRIGDTSNKINATALISGVVRANRINLGTTANEEKKVVCVNHNIMLY